jgi:hypothetical protein
MGGIPPVIIFSDSTYGLECCFEFFSAEPWRYESMYSDEAESTNRPQDFAKRCRLERLWKVQTDAFSDGAWGVYFH